MRMSFSAAGDSTPTVGSFAEAQGAPSTSQASTSRFTLRPTTPLGHHGVLSLGGLKGLIAGKGKTFCCVWEGPPEVLKLGGAELGPSGSGVVEVFRFEEGVSCVSFLILCPR